MAMRAAPEIRLIRAPNPSAMTHTGTNSYVLGRGEVAIIDPGPDDPNHLAALLAALAPGDRVAAILVTHAHLDHSALCPALAAATGAPVYAFGPAQSGRSAVMQALAAQGLRDGGEGLDHRFSPDHLLRDGALIDVGDWQIEAIHTPGHLGGHIAFAAQGQLFSGDHAMGWASSLVSPPDGDMGAYMASLDKLARREWHIMHPGHGAAVPDPAARLTALASHRRDREAQVLDQLGQHGPSTAMGLARRIYTETPPALLGAASRNVLAHLIDLTERNLTTTPSPLTADSQFHII